MDLTEFLNDSPVGEKLRAVEGFSEFEKWIKDKLAAIPTAPKVTVSIEKEDDPPKDVDMHSDLGEFLTEDNDHKGYEKIIEALQSAAKGDKRAWSVLADEHRAKKAKPCL